MSDPKPSPPMSNTKKYGLLGLAAILLIGAYMVGSYIDINKTYDHSNLEVNAATKTLKAGESVDINKLRKLPSDMILGDQSENPTVIMIEYGSLTCPHCAEFHKYSLASIKNDYIQSAKIQYIYRDYPLDGAALKGALLARCDLSKREAFLDLLYKKQRQWTQSTTLEEIEKNLTIIGKSGGLSADQVKKCLADKSVVESLLSVQKQSNSVFAISATPTVIINDQKYTGGLTPSELKTILDHLLADKTPMDKS